MGGKTSPDLAEISVWIDGTEYPADSGTTTAAGMTGTFVTNGGTRFPDQTPFQVDADTFVFGGQDGIVFKMASLNAAGQKIAVRYLWGVSPMTIDELTVAQWEGAHVIEDLTIYDVQDIVMKYIPADDLEAIEWTPNAEASSRLIRVRLGPLCRRRLLRRRDTAQSCSRWARRGATRASATRCAAVSARGDVVAVGAPG